MFLSGFQNLPPPYQISQSQALEWLAKAHVRNGGEADRMAKLLRRYGCSAEKIETRASFLRDFSHQDWSQMQLFRTPIASIDERLSFFQEVLLPAVDHLYENAVADFKHWIHVTCTGYLSPSLVQTIVSQRGWGEKVACLHAYHMGCYAAFPALRMARGNLDCEILHTELCTLHFDAGNHSPEQLVIQSLFADGVIRYRVSDRPPRPNPAFEVLDLKEVLVPESLGQMRWEVSSQGFRMHLGREVPALVEANLLQVIADWISPGVVYAIHPGGPRIIEAVQKALGLSDEQVYFSQEVLRRFGNLSSATLPHVWQSMLEALPVGTPVISMAFGPGLTVSAGFMRKV